ncbi:MAG TPA: DUF1553 domain-containing protein [Planctomycetaceae bacterium]|nr:DUF1553 domain-containing protein [Planctomycetaceae bacterium]
MQGEFMKIQWVRLPRFGIVCTAVALVASAGLISLDRVIADEGAVPAAASEGSLVEFVDGQLRQGWTDNEVVPSEPASDEEWVRRIYLDLCGRIPTLEETKAFLDEKSPRKRFVLIEKLLADEDYVRNFTTVWTNNTIGRATPRRVSRVGMEKFFREAFAKDRPWNEIVVDTVTASGHFEENGAVNYTLAQMQNQDDGVQLTAMTTRLFLGLQVQCTQCHNHPFNKWQQDQFWEYNSFFRQVGKRDHRKLDPNTGRMVDDYSEVVWQDFQGPVYYEKRSGMMQVAFPRFEGQEVDPGLDTDRRIEFGKLLTKEIDGQPPHIAQAMVNRMWSHFFGYGFTRPVDDMGPHNPASHPELLERLSREFVNSNYNLKELIRTICATEAYGLTSQFNEKNKSDDPAAGEMPLFSHMYLKQMQAEQMYDSLIVASNAHQAGRGGWSAQEEQRRKWMQQFVVAFDNDENAESTMFNGTIPQALMMMNSELIEKACSVERGSFLFEEFSKPGSEPQKIQELYMAALSRHPTKFELNKVMKMLNGNSYRTNKLNGYQDLFWALLNSNEFVFIH